MNYAFVGVIFALAVIGPPATAAATVQLPFRLDDNRITINAQITNSTGQKESVRAWVDTGNPDLWITANLADRLGLKHLSAEHPSPFGKVYLVALPRAFDVGGSHLVIPKTVRGIAVEAPTIGPGLNATVNIPASVLSQTEVEFDYARTRLVIGSPGSGDHSGIEVQLKFDAQTSLVSLPAVIDGTHCQLGLDTGATYSYLDKGLITRLISAHPRWSHMTGAIGAANIWGLSDEPQMQVLKIQTLRAGPLDLSQVGFGELPGPAKSKITGDTVAGILGGNVLIGFRMDIDYRNHVVYFDKPHDTDTNHLDMVGLVLHPGADGNYTVLKVVAFGGTPSVASIMPNDRLIAVDSTPITGETMGQATLALSGNPGQIRHLILQRHGRTYEVDALVRRFLN